MDFQVQSRQFIVAWNNKFIYDRIYRKKYNISFGSEQHKKTNQIDIYLDLLEDHLFKKWGEDYVFRKEMQESYEKTGEFIIHRENKMDEEDEKLFDNFQFGQDMVT